MPGASGARSPASQPKNAPMNAFERYLTLWVFICIVVGTGAGHYFPEVFQSIGRLELARVNIPVGVLIWVMIIPMLVKVDFSALGEVRRHARGIGVTLFINWLVKPFSMALLAWIFVRHVFAPWLPADQIDSYVAGLILLAAAPCTAMVFVWSRLSNGDPMFTLSQVALNDAIMVVPGDRSDHGSLGYADHVRRALHRHPRGPGTALAALAAAAWTGHLRCCHGADRAVVHHGAAADAGAAVRVPG